MSLFLDVSITAQSIVDAAWARATANRERLRRRLDVQAVREETERGGGRSWEQRYTTPTPLQYRPDEPVAYPVRRVPAAAITAGVFWIGGDGSSTYIIRSGDFSAAITEDISLPFVPGSIPGLGQFDFREVRTAFPLAGSTAAVCLYARVPSPDLAAMSLATYTELVDSALMPPWPGGYNLATVAAKQFWHLATRSTVARITDLSFPLESKAYYTFPYAINPPFNEAEQAYIAREFNTVSNPITNVSAEINASFSGILTPVSYGVRRLFDGQPFSTMQAFPGHDSFNVSPLGDTLAIAYPITLTPEQFEGYNLYAYWDANQPALCTSEAAVMGYPP